MRLYTFIPNDRTLAEEGLMIPARDVGEAIDLLFPDAKADANKRFHKHEWQVNYVELKDAFR